MRLTARRRPAVAFAIGILAASLLILIAAQIWNAWSARQDRLNEASAATFNMAKALAAQGESTIRIADAVLAGVVERFEHDGAGPVALERLSVYLRVTAEEMPELHGLFVFGADGGWLATSLSRPAQGNNADREYFKFHSQNPGRRVHVGPPIRSRTSGVWVLPVSRRLEHPDGRFAGVVLGTIEIDFFARLYDGFDVGKTGTIALALDNGTLIYRRPFNDSLPGTDISGGPVFTLYKTRGTTGTAMLTARMDQIERMYSYRRMNSFPLVVACALAKDEILSQWQRSVLMLAVASLLAIGFLAFLGKRLVLQIIIRDMLEHELLRARAALEDQNGQLAALARKDGLTGIANRRHFEQVIEQEAGRAERNRTPLAVIMIDVDHFKKYNDRYGHVAGDDCLRRVAAVIKDAMVRPGDLAARYGGEEFVGVLAETDEHGAGHVAERIRRGIEELEIEHADSDAGHVTVSIGVHAVVQPRQEKLSVHAIVTGADAMLYEAKRQGRNRVACRHSEKPDDVAVHI